MKFNQLLKDFFTNEELITMTQKSTLVYEDTEDVVYLILFNVEGSYYEVRAEFGTVNINDLSIVDTEGEEKDTSITKERLFYLLDTIETPSELEEIVVD